MNFKQQVEQELKGLNRGQVRAFAWRNAIRALPFLGHKGHFDYWKEEDRQKHLFSIFHALDIISIADADNAEAAAEAYGKTDEAYEAAGADTAAVDATNSVAYATAVAFGGDAAEATAAAVCAARIDISIGLENIILQDIRDIKANGKPQISIATYGRIWNNFLSALRKEGCAYWGNIYLKLFENNFEIDREQLNKRLSAPEEISSQGAAAVANYME